jgi:hypothetical protein
MPNRKIHHIPLVGHHWSILIATKRAQRKHKKSELSAQKFDLPLQKVSSIHNQSGKIRKRKIRNFQVRKHRTIKK